MGLSCKRIHIKQKQCQSNKVFACYLALWSKRQLAGDKARTRHMGTRTWFSASVLHLQDLRQCFAESFVTSSEEIAHFAGRLLGGHSLKKTGDFFKNQRMGDHLTDHFLIKYFHGRFFLHIEAIFDENVQMQMLPKSAIFLKLFQK